ncbi:MAG: DsrE family protein [Limisphaerales bacterium]
MKSTQMTHSERNLLFPRLRRKATVGVALLAASILGLIATLSSLAAVEDGAPAAAKKQDLGIIIYSTDAETVWNAFRFGVFALKQGDRVKVFLLAKGVECEKLDSKEFNVTGQMRAFIDAGGKMFACGTCLKLRQSEGTELCPISTMKDMYDIVRESDKVLTF